MKPIRYERTQSSLLIPEKFIDIYIEKTKNSSKEIYFHYLIKKYKFLVLDGTLTKLEKVKTGYQDENQFLIKKNFRPFNPDWIELGVLSNYLGISRTALFTWFLIFDLAGWDAILRDIFYESGVPPKVSIILLRSYIAKRVTVRTDRKILYKIRR